jgi:hypothetical protein
MIRINSLFTLFGINLFTESFIDLQKLGLIYRCPIKKIL